MHHSIFINISIESFISITALKHQSEMATEFSSFMNAKYLVWFIFLHLPLHSFILHADSPVIDPPNVTNIIIIVSVYSFLSVCISFGSFHLRLQFQFGVSVKSFSPLSLLLLFSSLYLKLSHLFIATLFTTIIHYRTCSCSPSHPRVIHYDMENHGDSQVIIDIQEGGEEEEGED